VLRSTTNRLDEAIAATERLEAGMVWVNNVLGDNDALPFGGWKASGMGRALSRLGLNAFRQPKMVMLDPKAELQGLVVSVLRCVLQGTRWGQGCQELIRVCYRFDRRARRKKGRSRCQRP
jgi:hypothetical protein